MESTGYGEESVSVSIEEFVPAEWTEKVYKPDIMNGRGTLYKKPGYNPLSSPHWIARLVMAAALIAMRLLCAPPSHRSGCFFLPRFL
jgi:4-oxalocrotonate tautomerase